MAQPLKAPHLAGTETSLPGHRFPALSPRAARGAHAELRSPPPQGLVKGPAPPAEGESQRLRSAALTHRPAERDGTGRG